MSGSGPQTAPPLDPFVVVVQEWPREPITSPRIARVVEACKAGAAGWLPLSSAPLLFLVVPNGPAAKDAVQWLAATGVVDQAPPIKVLPSIQSKAEWFAEYASGWMSDPKASYKVFAQGSDVSAYRLFVESNGNPRGGDVLRDQSLDTATAALTSMSISRGDDSAPPAPNQPRERHYGPHSDRPRPANAEPRYRQHRGTGLGPLEGEFRLRFNGLVSFSYNQKDPFRVSGTNRYNLRNLLPDHPDTQFLTEDGVRRFVGTLVRDWDGVDQVVARPAYATEGTDLDIYFGHAVHFRRFDEGKGRGGWNETTRRKWGTFREPSKNADLFPHPPSSSFRLGSGWP